MSKKFCVSIPLLLPPPSLSSCRPPTRHPSILLPIFTGKVIPNLRLKFPELFFEATKLIHRNQDCLLVLFSKLLYSSFLSTSLSFFHIFLCNYLPIYKSNDL